LKKEEQIFFEKDTINFLFPFYFIIDESLQIIDAGKSIRKLLPKIIGSNLREVFQFKRPFNVQYNFNSISEYNNQIIILSNLHVNNMLFRGQIVIANKDKIIFLGSPWITSAEDLAKHNLVIPDFAIHDVTTDMIQIIKTKEIISNDIEKLVETLKNQKAELQSSENKLINSNNRLSVLIQNMQSGILLEDENRKIILANKAFCDLFNIPIDPSFLIGQDCTNAAEESKLLFENSELFVSKIKTIVSNRKIVQNEEIKMVNETILERDFIPIYTDNLYRGHLWVYRNISKRKKNEIELVKAKERAIKLRKEKEQFMANMSHELRNPINIINGISGLFLDTKLSNQQKEYIHLIKTNSNNLLSLINDILDFEKIEARKIQINHAPFDFRKCVNELIASMKYQAENKNIQLQASIGNEIPKIINGDTLRLKQILLNLINNAIKFTEKGTVSLKINSKTLDDKNVAIQFEICDTGIGIADNQINNIFKRYAQANNQLNDNIPSSGLGLTIVKNLVELQGGKIEVKSKVGSGTCFKIVIPYEIAIEFEINQFINNTHRDFIKNKKILVVEDNKVNRMIIHKILEKQGAKITTAENGQIALEELYDEKFDLILLDLQMPVLDGYQTTVTLRNSKSSKNISTPIIALTANALPGEKEKCLKLGMNDYLSKPFQEADLLNKIELQISKTENNKKHFINLDYLNSIDQGDQLFSSSLITEIVKECPEILETINNAHLNGNFAELFKAIHKLKGSITIIANDEGKEILNDIESLSKQKKDSKNLRELIKKLNQYCFEAIAELNQEIKK